MASWPTGIETIKQLLAAGNLQKVAPSLDAARGSPTGREPRENRPQDLGIVFVHAVHADAAVRQISGVTDGREQWRTTTTANGRADKWLPSRVEMILQVALGQ